MRQLKDTTRRTEAVIGSQMHGEDGVDTTNHSKDAKNTRKVSSDGVAAVIRSIWHNNIGDQVCLPVSMEYLSKLCDACFVKMAGDAKSNIGIILMDQVAAIESDTAAGNNIIRVLTSTGTILTATMLRHMLDCINLLGTTYAFIVPYELSALLNRVQLFNGNAATLRSVADEHTMIGAHDGYNVKGPRLNDARYIKALHITVSLGNKPADAKRLCRCIRDNLVSKDGTMSIPSNSVISRFLMATNDSSQQEIHDRFAQSHLSIDPPGTIEGRWRDARSLGRGMGVLVLGW
jgi:hypothetical protein